MMLDKTVGQPNFLQEVFADTLRAACRYPACPQFVFELSFRRPE